MDRQSHTDPQAIISAAYLAAYGAGSWGNVARALAAIGDCDCKGVLRVLPRGNCGAIVATSGISDHAVELYNSYYGALNVYDTVLRRMVPGDVATISDCGIDGRAVERSEYGNDFLKRHEIGFGGAGSVAGELRASKIVATVNYDAARSDALDALYRNVFAAITPHLAQAVRIAAHNAQSARRNGVIAALSTLRSAALVLSGTGRVVGSNAAATEILQEGPLFVDRCQRLRGGTPQCDALIQRAIERSLSSARSHERLRVADYGALGELVLVVSPLPDDPCEAELWCELVEEERTAAIVHLVTDPPASAWLLNAIRSLYDLSADEACAAEAILKGRSTRTLAVCLGLNTYEASLLRERVKERLGVRTSADVVRRLAAVAQFAQDAGQKRP